MSHRLRSSCCCDFVAPEVPEVFATDCFLGYGTVPPHQFNPADYSDSWPGGTDNCLLSEDGNLYRNAPNQNIYDKWSGCAFPLNDEVVLTLERSIDPDFGYAGEYGWGADAEAPGGFSQKCHETLCANPCDPGDPCDDCCPDDWEPGDPPIGCCAFCDDNGNPLPGECGHPDGGNGNCSTVCRAYRCLGIDPPSFKSSVDPSYDPEQRQPIYVRYRKPQPGIYGQVDWQNHVGKIAERPYVYRCHMAAQWWDSGFNSSQDNPFNYGRGYNGGHRLWPLWGNPNGPSNRAGIPSTDPPVPNDPVMPHGTAHCSFGQGGNGGKWNSLYGRMSDYLSSTAGNFEQFFYFDGDLNRRGLYNYPLTWAQSMLIGKDWNTSSGGYIPIIGKLQGKNCQTDCPEDPNDTESPRPYGGYIREWGPAFFWLQGIADVDDTVDTDERGWYLNFWWLNGEIRPYYKNAGFGDDPCEVGFPYGLSPLNETLFGVFHREAYYERYWTGFRTDNYARIHGVPADTQVGTDEDGEPILGYPYNGVPGKVPGGKYFAISEDTWNERGSVSLPGNVPRAIGFRCSGIPVFTWEIEKLFVGGNGLGPATIPDLTQSSANTWEELGLEDITGALSIIQTNLDKGNRVPDVPLARAISSIIGNSDRRKQYRTALWVCAITGHAFPAEVTDVLELYGVLPQAQNWGEEHDYKIFKKKMHYFDFEGEAEENPDHEGCCLNVGDDPSSRLWGSCAFNSEQLYQLSYGEEKSDLCPLLISYILDAFGPEYLDEIPECFNENGEVQEAYLKDFYPEFYKPVKNSDGSIIEDENGNPRFFYGCSKSECAELTATGFCTFHQNVDGITLNSKTGRFFEVDTPDGVKIFDCGCGCNVEQQAFGNCAFDEEERCGLDSIDAAIELVQQGYFFTSYNEGRDHCNEEIFKGNSDDIGDPNEGTNIGFEEACRFAAELSLSEFYVDNKLASPCENEATCVNVPWNTCESIYGGQLAEGTDPPGSGITCPSIKPFNVDPENQGYCSPYGAVDEPPDGLANNELRFGSTQGICCTVIPGSGGDITLVDCFDNLPEEGCEYAGLGSDQAGPSLALLYPKNWKTGGSPDDPYDGFPYCPPPGEVGEDGTVRQCARTFSVSRNCLNNGRACGTSPQEWIPQQPDDVGGCEVWGAIKEKDQYFYGRPGGWFHICNFGAISSEDPQDGSIRESIRAAGGGNFLPMRFGKCGPCWSSGSYVPLKMQASLDIPLCGSDWESTCCAAGCDGAGLIGPDFPGGGGDGPDDPDDDDSGDGSDGGSNQFNCLDILFTSCVGYKPRPNPWITNARFSDVYNMGEPVPPLADAKIFISDAPPPGEGTALDYEGIFQPCGNESFTETCRGIWWQFHGNDYVSAQDVGYICGCDTVNNAFWLRTDPYENDNDPSIASWSVDPETGVTGIEWNNELVATRGAVHVFNLQNLSDEDSEFYQSVKTPDYTHIADKCVQSDGRCTVLQGTNPVTVKSKGFKFLLSASTESSNGFVPKPFALTGDGIPIVVGDYPDDETLQEEFEQALNDETFCGGEDGDSTTVLKVLYNEYTRFFEKIVTADNAGDLGVTFDEGKQSRVFLLNPFEQLDYQVETAAPDTLHYQIVEELEYRQKECLESDVYPYIFYYSREDIPGSSGTISIVHGNTDGDCVDGVKLRYSGQAARNTEYQWYHQPFVQVTGQPSRAYSRTDGAFCADPVDMEAPNEQAPGLIDGRCKNIRATYAPTTLSPNQDQCNFTMQVGRSYGPPGRKGKFRQR